jgi:phosphatidylinositol-3-phosphatase
MHIGNRAKCLVSWVACPLLAIATACAPSSPSQESAHPAPKTAAATLNRPAPCGTAKTIPVWQHVVWVVMENTSYDGIVGSSSAPFENRLAALCGLATNYYAVAHPSLPNYLAMTSGSTYGIVDDEPPATHQLTAPSLFSQLGSDWRSLQESMQVNCDRASSGDYAVRHNPAAYFVNLGTACKNQDVPLEATPDLSSRFTFVTPNLCHDMHDCSISTGDAWLSMFLPKLLASPEYRAGATAIFVTFDEDDRSAGNHVATIVIAPTVSPGVQSTESYTHYSLLRTTEEMLRLGRLGAAATAPSMRSAFRL